MSSSREDVVGDHAELDSCRAGVLHSASTSAVLPEPTGPPMPILSSACAHDRNSRDARYCWLIAAMSICGENDSMRRAARRDRDRQRAGTRSSVPREQRVRLSLTDGHQPHRRRDRGGEPRVGKRLDAPRAVPTPLDAQIAPNAIGSVTRDGPEPSDLVCGRTRAPRRRAAAIPSRGSSAWLPTTGAARSTLRPARSSAVQSPARTAAHAATPPAPRAVRSSRRGRRPSTRRDRRRRDAPAAASPISSPSEYANPPSRKQRIAQMQQRRAVFIA